ncbi:MAG: chromosomal replication initiator protein DnaA [Caulobacteraceae bacterium]
MTTGLATANTPVQTGGAVLGVAASIPDSVWARVSAALRRELGDAAFGSWIAPAQIRRSGAGLALVTPTGIARDWVKRNAWVRINELWAAVDPERRTLQLKARAELEADGTTEPSPVSPPLPSPTAAMPAAGDEPSRRTGLQERFTFDTFVAGPANEFALAVSRRVASWGSGAFNPVLIHGPYGFGKTHLLNAIAWEAARVRPDKKIVYLTAERFLTTFVKAMVDRSGSAFKDDLRGADLLLIDDVHFIGGKKSSQEELFHTLAALTGEGRRVVLSADKPPTALTEIDARLRSHLGAGLIAGIEPADRALRLAVLEKKLVLLSRELDIEAKIKPEVLQFLAERFSESIREMEGGLNTLAVRAGERLARLSLDDAQAILRPHLRGAERRVTVDDIQKAVAEHFGMKQADLLSERRTRAVARPRQAAMYLAKQLTTRSLPDIGRRFGGRDHTTVLHAVRRIEALRAEDAALAADLEAIARRLKD